MSKLNFLFFPRHNTGGHFVIWSLYYLSGQTHYEANNQLNSVASPEDFKTIKNAHLHRCDRIYGLQGCQQLELEPRLSDNYHVYLNYAFFSKLLNSEFNVNWPESTVEQRNHIENLIIKDTKHMIDYIQDRHKLVLVDFDHSDLLNIKYNDRYPLDWYGIPADNQDELTDRYEQDFFSGISQHFDQNIWDKREKVALMMRLPPLTDWSSLVNKQKPNAIYTTDDIWNDLPNVIVELLDYLELPLLQDRIASWKELYYVWREKHDNHFSRCFGRIVQAIVNGEYMCLKRFNLNFYKEALIQHALITKHNLNLKTWQLEKFPSNTKDIHLLLEPNFHTL